MRQIITAVVAIATALGLAGCITTEESDIPWNAPAGWEGSPFIPGLSE